MKRPIICLLLPMVACATFMAAQAYGSLQPAFAEAVFQSSVTMPAPPVKWKVRVPSVGYATHVGVLSPERIVSNGMIFVPGGDSIGALDMETGKEVWRFSLDFSLLSLVDTALAKGTLLLTYSWIGDLVPRGGIPPTLLVALDIRTGQERWRHEEGGHTPYVQDEIVYFSGSETAGEPTIYGLDAATGNVRWVTPAPEGDYISDIIGSPGVLYVLTSEYTKVDNRVHYYVQSIDIETRQIKWRVEAQGTDDIGMGLPSLQVIDNLLFVTGAHSLQVLETAAGIVRWKYSVGPYRQHEVELYPLIRTAPAVVDGVVFLGATLGSGTPDQQGYYNSVEPFLVALDATTGEEKWRLKVDSRIDIGDSLAVADGTAYFTAGDVRGYAFFSYLYAIDLNSRSVKWRLYAGDENYFVPPSAHAEGTLFIGSANTNPDAGDNADTFYAISTATMGMPKAGDTHNSTLVTGFIGTLSIVLGAILLSIRQTRAFRC